MEIDGFQEQRPLLLIISGPAGSGKTTLCDRLMATHPEFSRVVTTTTRAPRQGEVDGRDYYFVSEEKFAQQIREGAFYEYAVVHGRHYGTYREEVDRRLRAGSDVLLNIDVQGASAFRAAAAVQPELARSLVTVFLLPPSLAELEARLKTRGTDDAGEIRRRLITAETEIRQSGLFDYCIPGGSREDDFRRLAAIVMAEKMRNVSSAPNASAHNKKQQ